MQLVGLLLFITVTTFLMGAFGREIVSAPVAAVLQPPLTYKAVPVAGPQPDATSLSGAPAASSKNYTGLFQEFVTKYRRSYAGTERELRFRIFKENVDTIERLSKDTHEGMYAINNMADISPAEYKKRFVTTRKRTAPKVPSLLQTQGPNDREPQMIPDEFDWTAVVDEKTKVATNYMQPVQNQGECASCWAFAAAAALEAQFRIQFRKEVKLSEAAFIACTGKGCNEGRAEDVFNGFGGGKGRFKMVRDEALSYENLVHELHKPTKNVLNSQGRPVREELVNPKRLQEACSTAQNDALQHLPEVNIEHTAIQHDESMLESTEEAFKRSLISNGPLVVFLHYPEDSQFAGPNYLAQEKMCTVKGVVQEADHIVVIVGYGTREITVGKKKISVNVWKIRNSHGDDVGDKGYFYVERGKNTCHVLSDGVSVTLRSPQKPVVQGNQKRKKMVEQSKSERDEYDAEAPKTEVKKQRQNPKKL